MNRLRKRQISDGRPDAIKPMFLIIVSQPFCEPINLFAVTGLAFIFPYWLKTHFKAKSTTISMKKWIFSQIKTTFSLKWYSNVLISPAVNLKSRNWKCRVQYTESRSISTNRKHESSRKKCRSLKNWWSHVNRWKINDCTHIFVCNRGTYIPSHTLLTHTSDQRDEATDRDGTCEMHEALWNFLPWPIYENTHVF